MGTLEPLWKQIHPQCFDQEEENKEKELRRGLVKEGIPRLRRVVVKEEEVSTVASKYRRIEERSVVDLSHRNRRRKIPFEAVTGRVT